MIIRIALTYPLKSEPLIERPRGHIPLFNFQKKRHNPPRHQFLLVEAHQVEGLQYILLLLLVLQCFLATTQTELLEKLYPQAHQLVM